MCSMTFGPAIWPSLVTWPTTTMTGPRDFASAMSDCMQARTWLTVPGAESMALGPQRLDGVDHDEIRRGALLGGGEDALHAGFGDEAERDLREAEAGGAKPDLVRRLFAGEVERAEALRGDGGGGLKQQRRFADAGLAAEQHRGALREAVAHRAVEFADAGRDALDLAAFVGEAFDGRGLGAPLRLQPRRRRARTCAPFLRERVPLAAGRAFALPFGGDRAAGLADIARCAAFTMRAHAVRVVMAGLDPAIQMLPSRLLLRMAASSAAMTTEAF